MINQVVLADFDESITCVKMLSRIEGLLLGISSGAALSAALTVAKETEGKNIVILMPDGMEKYLNT